MRTEREVQLVLELADAGLNKSEIARWSGMPRGTVREWLKGRIPSRVHDLPPRWIADEAVAGPRQDYAYLLGMYLGDGCISTHPRGVYRLRIVLDNAYGGYPRAVLRRLRSPRRSLDSELRLDDLGRAPRLRRPARRVRRS